MNSGIGISHPTKRKSFFRPRDAPNHQKSVFASLPFGPRPHPALIYFLFPQQACGRSSAQSSSTPPHPTPVPLLPSLRRRPGFSPAHRVGSHLCSQHKKPSQAKPQAYIPSYNSKSSQEAGPDYFLSSLLLHNNYLIHSYFPCCCCMQQHLPGMHVHLSLLNRDDPYVSLLGSSPWTSSIIPQIKSASKTYNTADRSTSSEKGETIRSASIIALASQSLCLSHGLHVRIMAHEKGRFRSISWINEGKINQSSNQGMEITSEVSRKLKRYLLLHRLIVPGGES